MRGPLAILLLLTQTPGLARAETLMTAEEFESWSTGKTLEYTIDGVYWGSEQHLSGRRTIDADAEGPCVEGRWYPAGDAICFVYDTSPGPHCWHFWRQDGTVLAESLGTSDPLWSEVALSDKPLACDLPGVGV